MDEQKPGFDWKRSLITVAIVLVTAGVVGGTVWYLMDQNAKSIADSNAKSEVALQKQIDEITKKVTASNSTIPSSTSTATPGTSSDTATLVVVKTRSDSYMAIRKNNNGTSGVGFLETAYITKLRLTPESASDLFTSGATTVAGITNYQYVSTSKISDTQYQITYNVTTNFQGEVSTFPENIYFEKVGSTWMVYRDSIWDNMPQ